MSKLTMRSLAIGTTLAIALETVVAPNPAALEHRMTSPSTVFESLHQVPQGWIRLDQTAAPTRLRLRISLGESDHVHLEQTLSQVSDPDHPRYGQRLKRIEFKALVKLKDESTYA